MDKIVVYTGTRNVYPHMEVAAKSLLCHTKVDRVFFLIEDDEYPGNLPDCITTMNVSGQQWFDPSGPNYKSTWTYMAFLRLAFGKLFPQYHQVLYLDTDTLVLNDISPLLSTPLPSPYCFAMVQEDVGDVPLEMIHAMQASTDFVASFQSDNPRPAFCIRPYYNSGVMLMNLDKLRQSGMDDRMIQEINTTKYPYPDQDIINLFCHDRIKPLQTEYNVIPALFPDFPPGQIRIKHFASDKPLWKSSLWQSYRRMSWQQVINMRQMPQELPEGLKQPV